LTDPLAGITSSVASFSSSPLWFLGMTLNRAATWTVPTPEGLPFPVPASTFRAKEYDDDVVVEDGSVDPEATAAADANDNGLVKGITGAAKLILLVNAFHSFPCPCTAVTNYAIAVFHLQDSSSLDHCLFILALLSRF